MKQKDLERAKTAILNEFNAFLKFNLETTDVPGAAQVRSTIVGQFSRLREKLED